MQPLPDPTTSARDELAYRLRQQTLLTAFGTFCVRAPELPALLHEATRATAEGLECTFSKVLELQPASDFLVVAGVGWRPGVVGTARLGSGTNSPAGFAVASGEPVTSNDLSTEERFRTPSLLLEHGVRSAINVLIRGDGDTYGVLEVDSGAGGRFTAWDTAFLQSFANLLGVAIERARLRAEIEVKDQRLRQALEHEKILTVEVHHRVKNSLALIAGLLTMQRRGAASPELARALEDAEARIYAVAQVHDHLASHGKGQTVPLDAFVTELCERLGEAHPRHRIMADIVGITVSADRAVSIGLLINELVTNALKYAYTNGGPVRVSIQREEHDSLHLEVTDGGSGMAADASRPAAGLGTKVITSLARQLGGTAVWHRAEPGTRVSLDFHV